VKEFKEIGGFHLLKSIQTHQFPNDQKLLKYNENQQSVGNKDFYDEVSDF
jgi:hypothetical protein